MPFDHVEGRTVASRMRELFGPDGQNWCRGELYRDGAFCLLGAFQRARGVPLELMADTNKQDDCYPSFEEERILREAISLPDTATVYEWNDQSATFADILRVLDRMEELELAARVQP